MYEAADLRKGLKIQIEGEPYILTDFSFVKPGKGQALYKCKLKNLITGSQFDRTFRSGDRFEEADLDEQEMEFLYQEGSQYCFMNTSSYEQVHMEEEQVGDAKNYLTNNIKVSVSFFQAKPMAINLPTFVDLKVVKADPGVRAIRPPARPSLSPWRPDTRFKSPCSSKKGKPSAWTHAPASMFPG